MKAIQTEYEGYLFRSRLEARWAVFFDALGIRWQYEPEGWEMADGTRYLPDFFLPGFNTWAEVKGVFDPRSSDKTAAAVEDLITTDPHAGFLILGDTFRQPRHGVTLPYILWGGPQLQGVTPVSVLTFSAWLPLGSRAAMRLPVPPPDTTGDLYENLPLVARGYSSPNRTNAEQFLAASRKAQQARFEHGETPEGGRYW